MSSNRVTLEGVSALPIEELVKLPVEQIVAACEDVAELKARAKQLDDKLHEVLTSRYARSAAEKRQAKKEDTGTVRIADDSFIVIADLPKRIDWNEEGLCAVEAKLFEMGEPPADYIKIRRTVSENSFKAWPKSLRDMFEPYRTVGVGKPSFKFERAKEAHH